MIKLAVYDNKGAKKADMTLPKEFEAKENMTLLAQARRVYEDRKHPGNSRVKTRGEVVTSKRKIYKQKGTGGARHGAKSAPIFVGGGVAHGPKGIKRVLEMPLKMRKVALRVALTLKAKEGKLVVVNGMGNISKTKDAKILLDKILKASENQKKVSKATLVLSNKNKEVSRAFSNIADLKILPSVNLNSYDVFLSGTLVFDYDAFTKDEPLDKEKVVAKKISKPEVVKTVKTKTVKKVSKK